MDGVRFVGHPRSITSLPEEEEVMRYVAEVSKDAGGAVRGGDDGGEAAPDVVAPLSLSSSPRDSTKDLHHAPDSSSSSNASNITMFVVVVALNSQTSYPVVKSYHELAKDIAQAIRNEEM